ncbi:hypothetical protein MPER_15041 [Moniliophthora perniciosa FA553]|nr:hypothetical protein MPER_15041 [Moniliophthora perniciosa FA553]
MVKILLEGAVRYAEVQYFFLVEKKGTQYSLAAVKMYTEPDTDILSESVQQLRVCRYLGNAGICIIDAKWITEVVGMVPFKGFGRRVDPTEFYSMEKLRCPTVHDVENEEDDIEE